MVLLGYPKIVDGNRLNMAGVLKDGRWVAEYAKQQLPNYQVFDEKRYFSAGKIPCIFDLNKDKLSLMPFMGVRSSCVIVDIN